MSINDEFTQSCVIFSISIISISADLCLLDICMYLILTCCDWLTYIAITFSDWSNANVYKDVSKVQKTKRRQKVSDCGQARDVTTL